MIENRYITQAQIYPDGAPYDGLGFCDNQSHHIRNCIIDLSGTSLDMMDEAVSFTWGSSGLVENCVIKGAGKLILCGSGDQDRRALEEHKSVTFKNCILEDFSRRGPEVQCGMKVTLENCLIKNWGDPRRFLVRSFGAWAHDGGELIIRNCVFEQGGLLTRNFLSDLVSHIGQAVNDSGIKSLLTWEAWLPGRCRGATATAGGSITCENCYKNHWWVKVQNLKSKMSFDEAEDLKENLEAMYNNLQNICS